jgi:hypothetical protein
MKIDTGDSDLEVTKGLASVRPAVVQLEFSSDARRFRSREG